MATTTQFCVLVKKAPGYSIEDVLAALVQVQGITMIQVFAEDLIVAEGEVENLCDLRMVNTVGKSLPALARFDLRLSLDGDQEAEVD